jgi:hypothetical protein
MRWMVIYEYEVPGGALNLNSIYEYEVPGGALNLNSTKLLTHGRQGDLPLQGKFPMAEPRIEPGTS